MTHHSTESKHFSVQIAPNETGNIGSRNGEWWIRVRSHNRVHQRFGTISRTLSWLLVLLWSVPVFFSSLLPFWAAVVFVFLFVVILTFYFEIISIRSILISWEWDDKRTNQKNELLRRKRMIVMKDTKKRNKWRTKVFFLSLSIRRLRPFIEQVSLFIEMYAFLSYTFYI